MTKHKVKTFSAGSEHKLDKKVNTWLDEHPEYIILSISLAATSAWNERLMAVFYEADEAEAK